MANGMALIPEVAGEVAIFSREPTPYVRFTLEQINADPARHPVFPQFDPRYFEDEWREVTGRMGARYRDRCSVTPRSMGRFLSIFSEVGRFSHSARAVASTEAAYRYFEERCDGFRNACEDAYSEFQDKLHSEALSRAVDGWDEPVFYQGQKVGYIRRKSDKLMELMLKAHLPEKFRDRVDVNAHLTGGVMVAPAGVTADAWSAQFGALAVLGGGGKVIEGG